MNFLWVTKDTFHSYWYGPRGPRYIKRCSGIHWTLWRFCAPRLNQNCFLKIRQFWLILAHQTSKFPLWPLGTCQKWEKNFSSKGYCGYANMGKFECMYLSWLECINAGSMVIVLNWKWLLWLCFRKFALNLKILLQTDSNFVCMAQDIFQIDMQ